MSLPTMKERANKNVVLVCIPSAKGKPTHFKKKSYIRIDSNKTDLRNFPEYVRIIYNSLEDWSAKIIDNASISDLDDEALKVAREKFKERSVIILYIYRAVMKKHLYLWFNLNIKLMLQQTSINV